MQRKLLQELLNWKSQATRKPLLIDGARQTGKTYLLTELFSASFERTLHIDFLKHPRFIEAFAQDLSPSVVTSNLKLLTGNEFDIDRDLLVLDEIGECPRAVTALKYFAEDAPHAYVAATGSNIGLLNSFPVGKVLEHHLRPLSFHEFLMACANPALTKAFEQRVDSSVVHGELMGALTDYLFVGGMPEAVATWVDTLQDSILTRVQAVSQVHADLLAGYQRDFGKYAGKVNAQLIEAVFSQIPLQLSSVLDDSVKRFRFKDVFERKSRFSDFDNAIVWLHRSRLALLNYPIEGTPRIPLVAYQKPNRLKLFLFDVGLLNHMLGSSYLQIKSQSYEYKGFIAENFVQQELAVLGIEPTHAWNDARAEIEFLLTTPLGEIVPVEVKSGVRTRARSLTSYIQKYQPSQVVKLSASRGARTQVSRIEESHEEGSSLGSTRHLSLPLYDVQHLPRLLGH